MKTGTRNSIAFLALVSGLVLNSCREKEFLSLTGKTMGTYYSIQYDSDQNFHVEIDSILSQFISAASTYDSTSEISEFNRNGVVYFRTPHLHKMLSMAKQIHAETRGAFEPTLFPLISVHGFGPSRKNIASQSIIGSLLHLVSFSHIQFDSVKVWTLKKGVQLDLNAMGEGYAIELISGFLEENQIRNYKVEIGGEMKCNGRNPEGDFWLIGIEDPAQRITRTVRLQNESISTSGSYRNFSTDSSGKKQSHLIDPRTGYPIQNNLLSVTSRASSAIHADAFATACMVMGFNEAIQFVKDFKLNALITYEESGTAYTWHTKSFFHNEENRAFVRR